MSNQVVSANTEAQAVAVVLALPSPTPRPVPVANDMVYVPAGDFLMGTRDKHNGVIRIDWNNEDYQHTFTLDGFWIDCTEATYAQYRGCIQAGACQQLHG